MGFSWRAWEGGSEKGFGGGSSLGFIGRLSVV